jgi:hypothetical protein
MNLKSCTYRFLFSLRGFYALVICISSLMATIRPIKLSRRTRGVEIISHQQTLNKGGPFLKFRESLMNSEVQ